MRGRCATAINEEEILERYRAVIHLWAEATRWTAEELTVLVADAARSAGRTRGDQARAIVAVLCDAAANEG